MRQTFVMTLESILFSPIPCFQFFNLQKKWNNVLYVEINLLLVSLLNFLKVFFIILHIYFDLL